MKSNIILLVLVCVLLISCTNTNKISKAQESVTFDVLKRLVPDADFSKKQFVLIIPFGGCLSCFKEATSLIPEISKKQGLIIMPNSLKRVVTNTLDDLGIARDLVIIDTLQLSIKKKLVQGNPKIYLIENNKIIFSEMVVYPNFEKIKKEISSN